MKAKETRSLANNKFPRRNESHYYTPINDYSLFLRVHIIGSIKFTTTFLSLFAKIARHFNRHRPFKFRIGFSKNSP